MFEKKLSILIIAKNEEKQIKDCLNTVNFGDELVLILDSCEDNTKKIASRFTKKIFCGSWENEGQRRNFGIQKCSGDWVLEIDADERASKALGLEIRNIIKTSKFDYHIIPVRNFIGKQVVKYGWGAYFGKSAYPGLFKKHCKKWGHQNVHPEISFEGKKGPMLTNFLTHFYCKDTSDMFKKLNSYSDARAKDILNLNINENMMKNIRRLFSRFWKCYVLRKGYKEREYGFIIALLAALYPLISFLKYKNILKK